MSTAACACGTHRARYRSFDTARRSALCVSRLQYSGGRSRGIDGPRRQPGSHGAFVKILTGGCSLYLSQDGQVSTAGTWTARTVVARNSGSQRITQIVSEYAPGCSPSLVNPQAEEVLYVVCGEGTCRINGFAYGLRPGAAIFVPPAAVYSVENSGAETVRIVGSCCPEDPQRHIVLATASC